MDHALEIAVDAISRRARILEGTEPDVSACLRELAAEIELYMPKPWAAAGLSDDDQDERRWQRAAAQDRARRKAKEKRQ